jgi:putative resolvase
VLGDHDGDGAGIEGFEDVRDIAGVGDVVAGMQFDGVSYRTALNWFHAGTLPVSARQLPTGTIVVEPSAEPSGKLTVVFRPLSSLMSWNDRPEGLDEEAGNRGITLDATASEVGSGVTGNRARLGKVLAYLQVSGIVVEHRDRRARFGVEHLEAARAATGRRIIVVNPDGVRDDLVRDMTRGRGRRCVLAGVLAGMVAGLIVAALRLVSGALPPRW